MFIINKETNSITPLNKKSFSELGFRERAHLQEWLEGNPKALGEDLLIIQKEFSGFSETNERLDLLALDKEGNLVVIENKLDDSGRDVTWQALEYAAYCSTLKKHQIEEIFQAYLDSKGSKNSAQEVLNEFFDEGYPELNVNKSNKQRIILIAANFRKEVTSTVMWLINFKIHLQCFKATPYEFSNQYFLTLDQIIPTKDAQDYVISMAHKVQDEINAEDEVKSRHKVRLKFWGALLKAIDGKSRLYQNSNATKDHWLIAGGAGMTYVTYNLVITRSSSAVQLNFGRPSQEQNKLIFDAFYEHKNEIEEAFGEPLVWERMDDKKSSRISFYKPGQNYFNEEEWPEIIEFLITYINKLDLALKPYCIQVRNKLLEAIRGDEQIEEEVD